MINVHKNVLLSANKCIPALFMLSEPPKALIFLHNSKVENYQVFEVHSLFLLQDCVGAVQ